MLNEDGSPFHGGTGSWSLPHDGQPGDWMPPIEGDLVPCKNGYHLCREGDLLTWLGPAIFAAEYRGERVDAEDKIVVREARLLRRLNWNERTARLFACDCAERVLPIFEREYPNDKRPRNAIETVLPIFEREYPNDKRPRNAIETARRYANGEATDEELAAARDAVWAAAWAAAWDAARAAARDAAWAAARDAAWAAARDAARDAAWDAARDAEREWQTSRLVELLSAESP
jgi:hypothetical protein